MSQPEHPLWLAPAVMKLPSASLFHTPTLFRVVAQRVPNAMIGACEHPDRSSRFVGFFNRGEELILDEATSTEDGWVRMKEKQLGYAYDKIAPGWVKLDGSPQFGQSLEQVVE